MDDLIKRFGNWIDVDWDEIKSKLDKINDYPEKTFTGWHTKELLIKRAGEPGNRWGYKFFIIKMKKDKN